MFVNWFVIGMSAWLIAVSFSLFGCLRVCLFCCWLVVCVPCGFGGWVICGCLGAYDSRSGSIVF